ncbi:hypothetical protein KUTeg_015146 [Tegillarca granosa]|uniref:Signal transducer and activator of transcription n=1 Tax=Tegillarca granosa TaxID=220873 RepID=A0ABQ9EU05_TEGGR|nr:hypothetical protein KUTeg_015146 [Tegillarca granosa]
MHINNMASCSNRENVEEISDNNYMSSSVKKSKLKPNDDYVEMEDDDVTPLFQQGDFQNYGNTKVESNGDIMYNECNGFSNGNGSYSMESSMNGGHKLLLSNANGGKFYGGNMSLWTKTQQLPQEALKQIQTTYQTYGNHFPIEVRHYFAQWIEEKPWSQLDENNPQHEIYANQLLEELIQNIGTKAAELPTNDEFFILKLKLEEIASNFKNLYSSAPLQLVKVVKACLSVEEKLVDQVENPAPAMDNGEMGFSSEVNRQIQTEIECIQQRTQMAESDLKQLQNKQELFIVQYQNQLKVNSQLQQLNQQPNTQNRIETERKLRKQKEDIEKQLISKAEELLSLRLTLASKHQETFCMLDELQKKIVDGELIQWKRKQQLAGNGVPFDSQLLETLQQWCEALAEMIWKNRQQVLQVEILRQRLPIDVPPGRQDLLPELNQKITGLLSSLVTSTFIVETQPPQVLKKEARFTATVRLLVGGKLNIQMTPPQVKATIISEHQAQGLLRNDTKAKNETSGEILNNAGTMEFHQAKRELSITFRNMSLKRIKRADRKGCEAVTEEKFCILFQSDFQIGNGELMFQVWTLSLPVVVTVHGNQECNALATVLWDNQFAEPGRTPFKVPENVPWISMADLLSCKFQSMTGKGLTRDNISYLASKVFGGKPNDDYSQHVISWSQFNKDTLPSRNFTFWEWFYAIMKITREHLKSQWIDNSILGFVSKIQAQDMLLTKPSGTFLLRFSDSETGGITIAWVAEDTNKTGERTVWNLAPYGTKDFAIRSLSDRIKDLPSLVNLYPDIPKQQAFGKYYSAMPDKTNQTNEGYIKTQLIATIPIATPVPMSLDNPQSPPSFYGPPESPASSVYSAQVVTPRPYPDVASMDALDDLDMDALNTFPGATDYGTDDIDNINVNQLLYNAAPST